MQQRAQSNRIGYTVVTQWLQHRLHWTRAATTQTKAADKPPTLDTRSNNTDKSGRQTANAGHAQQQHRQKRQTNRQRNKTHAATTRTAVCCSFCPPRMCTTVCLPAEPAITTLSKRARKVSPEEVSALHSDSSSEEHCVEMNLSCQRCINHESRFRVPPAQPRLD